MCTQMRWKREYYGDFLSKIQHENQGDPRFMGGLCVISVGGTYRDIIRARRKSIKYAIEYLQSNVWCRHYLNGSRCGWYSRNIKNACTQQNECVLRHSVYWWDKLLRRQQYILASNIAWRFLVNVVSGFPAKLIMEQVEKYNMYIN